MPGFLSDLLAAEDDPLDPKKPHFSPKAKRVIFLFMTGGVSHVDTFDPKPFLNKNHDKPMTKGRRYYKGSGWGFKKHGQCGMEFSDLFPHIGGMADDICMIRSMQNINGDHFGATIGLHTGSDTFKRPSIGSWVSYGLGTYNANLPSFMVISPGLPYAGGQIWGSDFLPVLHQGTRIIPGPEPIANMRQRKLTSAQQREELGLLEFFNRQHLNGRENDSNLRARIKSFETAAGMQTAAPEAFDLSKENEATHKLYGLKRGDTKSFGWQCMVGRRLIERGVRFVELIDGDTRIDYNWDAHANMTNYDRLARNVDQPIAGLLRDLKDRGMMEDTLLVFATEFGRGPFQPTPGVNGRGHHSRVYSSWLAGAGIKGGMIHGASDELGDNVAKDVVTVHDFQATILHLLGIDHERLTYRHAGRNFRLTDVHGNVVKPILA
ncbi:MAG TPA: DUF1501 domain-containing protein [Gammaproteobacteria bacterium]|nr:DUF1501 domain-containing protein [Gammaproteobacteria bacterium]